VDVFKTTGTAATGGQRTSDATGFQMQCKARSITMLNMQLPMAAEELDEGAA
jgi:hypothetical protein